MRSLARAVEGYDWDPNWHPHPYYTEKQLREDYRLNLLFVEREDFPRPHRHTYNKMKRNYGGAFYPQKKKLVRSSRTVSGMTVEGLARMQQQRALAARKRGLIGPIRPLNFPEIKAIDVPRGAGDTISTTAVITNLIPIQAGSSFFNRIGRKIELKSLTLKGIFATLQTQANEQLGRVMVIYDRQTNGAFPAIADILQTTDQTGANTTTSYSGINMNYRDRFEIIIDKKLYLPALTDTAGAITNPGHQDQMNMFPNCNFYVKLKNRTTVYRADSSPAVIGDIATGGLYLVVFGSLAAANSGWTLFWESRVRYGDS